MNAPTEEDNETFRPLTRGMRIQLRAAGTLVVLAGFQLFVLTEQTDRFFSWTIDPPLTAAFMGAAYFASALIEWQAASRRYWADARIAVPAVFLFTTLTLVVTLVHLDRFHFGPEFESVTQGITWFWLVIYAVVPVLMATLWIRQAKVPGADPPPGIGLPRWLRAVVAIQGGLMAVVGLGLLIVPTATLPLWPWVLTPLTARAIGAWLVSLAVVAGHALKEDSYRRLRPAAWAFLAFGVLEGVALARYPSDMEWGSLSAGVFLVVLLSTVVVGGATLAGARRQ